jgi:peptidoglycan/xylan/chitin deacetylase (PgdA/CDA1 family)
VVIYGLANHKNETIIISCVLVCVLGVHSLFSLLQTPIETTEIVNEEGLDDLEINAVTSLNEAQNFTLTFDDGPHIETTPVILEYLKKFKIKNAIFFVRGDRVKENPNLIKKIVDYGYKIGYHSMQHTNQAKITELEINNDIKEFKLLIKGILPDYKLELARPPYGGMTKETVKIFNQIEINSQPAIELNEKLIAPHILKAYSSNGLKTLLWNIDFKDWEKRISVFYAARKFRKDLHQYWLFHEMPIKKGTVFDNKITKDLPEFLMFILNPNKALSGALSGLDIEENESVEIINPSEKFKAKAKRYAEKFGIDPKLFYALIKQESVWRMRKKNGALLRSPKGATGLTQVMPFNVSLCTKESLTNEEKVEWLANADNNLFCGAKIFKMALAYWSMKYPNDKELATKYALAEYNAGRHAVENRNALTAFRETRNYVAIIWRDYND